MTVVAMTREMATNGSEVAVGLAERLGLEIVHHELVEHDIAERAGMPESEVHRYLEGEASLYERWTIDRNRMSRYTALEILELAARGDVLIRGWGATYLLRSIPHVVCVRICAPMEYREAVLMKRVGITSRELARREIKRNDAAHNGTMQRMFGIDWEDPSLYAIVLNTARVPIADCVDQVASLAATKAFEPTERSRAALGDLLIAARARMALERAFGPRSLGHGLEVEVRDGHVVLTGAATDTRVITDAIRLLQDIEGVRGVESKVEHVGFVPHFN
jgi:cytidylate kinase